MKPLQRVYSVGRKIRLRPMTDREIAARDAHLARRQAARERRHPPAGEEPPKVTVEHVEPETPEAKQVGFDEPDGEGEVR